MDEMREFALWVITQLPDFLLAPPVSAFVGLVLVFFCVQVIRAMINLR